MPAALNIHNTWALLTVRRQLTLDDPTIGRTLVQRSTALLDGDSISEQSRRELTSIVYSLHTDGITGNAITAAVTEYEAQETLEAVVARDADKLECLVQAVEYRHQGIDNVQRWIDSSRAALKTSSAHRLADAALAGQPLAWLTPPPPPA
ncbi:HD domain-containing protein [Micromonospora profundi]|uniref:HD domain-containing protein n=1 Tax=Micromonospora profundi TaxID=1420889 RepID=UPI003659FCFB